MGSQLSTEIICTDGRGEVISYDVDTEVKDTTWIVNDLEMILADLAGKGFHPQSILRPNSSLWYIFSVNNGVYDVHSFESCTNRLMKVEVEIGAHSDAEMLDVIDDIAIFSVKKQNECVLVLVDLVPSKIIGEISLEDQTFCNSSYQAPFSMFYDLRQKILNLRLGNDDHSFAKMDMLKIIRFYQQS